MLRQIGDRSNTDIDTLKMSSLFVWMLLEDLTRLWLSSEGLLTALSVQRTILAGRAPAPGLTAISDSAL